MRGNDPLRPELSAAIFPSVRLGGHRAAPFSYSTSGSYRAMVMPQIKMDTQFPAAVPRESTPKLVAAARRHQWPVRCPIAVGQASVRNTAVHTQRCIRP